MAFLAQLVVWLNLFANALGRIFLAPIAFLPGWLSATLVAVVTGVLLLIVFKYTSNQRAIKRVRDDVSAQLLALKLFKDSAAVALRAQGRILVGSFRLLILAIVPMLIMVLPVYLFLGQLAAWYQYRPLRVGEDTVVTMKLAGNEADAWPEVQLQPAHGVDVTAGPVRVQSKRELCWDLRAKEPGSQNLIFKVGDQRVDKSLAIGDGFLRVSPRRPAWDWSDALLYPCEKPFATDLPVESIELEYPQRSSWTSGTDWWVVYWFVASTVAALCLRKTLGVNI
jgi:uncharacterized membrane protein (DUF106 family)